jgi:hypothetical protein
MGEALALLDHTTQRAPCGTSYLVLDRSYLYGKTQLARSSGVMVPAGRATSPAPFEVHALGSRAPAFFTTTTGCALCIRFERTVGTRGKGEGKRTADGGGHAQHPGQYRSEPRPCGGTGLPSRFGPNSIEQLSGLHIARCGARPVRKHCVRHLISLSAPSGSKRVTTGVGVKQVGSGRPFCCLSKRIRKEQPDELPPSSVQTGQATFSDTSRGLRRGRRGRGGGGRNPCPASPS